MKIRSHDLVQAVQGFRIGKDQTAHFPTVQGAVRLYKPVPEYRTDLIHCLSAGAGQFPGQGVAVYYREAPADKITADSTFSAGNTSCDSDETHADEFPFLNLKTGTALQYAVPDIGHDYILVERSFFLSSASME